MIPLTIEETILLDLILTAPVTIPILDLIANDLDFSIYSDSTIKKQRREQLATYSTPRHDGYCLSCNTWLLWSTGSTEGIHLDCPKCYSRSLKRTEGGTKLWYILALLGFRTISGSDIERAYTEQAIYQALARRTQSG